METMNDKQEAIPARFEEIVAQLESLLEELQSGPTYHGGTLRHLPPKGVYVFYEDSKPMYVGRVCVAESADVPFAYLNAKVA